MFSSRGRWRLDRHPFGRLLTGIVAAAFVALSPAPARAQWFSPWSVMEEMDAPSLGMRQLRQYALLLELSADQKSAAEELLGGYEREYRAISVRMKEVGKSIQEEYDNDEEIDVWREVWPKVIKNFMQKTDKLDKGLMDDLKTLLDSAQQARWPQVERLHRRQSTLKHGSRAGEQIDLVDLVEGLRLDSGAMQSAAALLEQYAADLDRELAARNKFIEDGMDRFFDVWMTWDETKMKELYGEMNKLSQKIVDVNRTYAKQIQGVLPPERQGEFDLKVKLATYPRVYKKTYTTRVLEAAEALADLDAGQREGIKGIRESFERESATINEKWAAALAEKEAKDQDNPMMFMWGGEEDPKIVEARKQRKDLEKKTVDSIKAILTEEQRKKLPEKKWKPEFDLDAPSPKR
jgi:hypothetical protein